MTVTVRPALDTEDETGAQDAGPSQYQASAFTTWGWSKPGLRYRAGGGMWSFWSSDRASVAAVGGAAGTGTRTGTVICGADTIELSTGAAEVSQDLYMGPLKSEFGTVPGAFT